MINFKNIITLFVVYLISTKCVSQDTIETGQEIKRGWSIGVIYDQDHNLELLRIKSLNEDRNYTLGFGLFFQADWLQNLFLFGPNKALNKIFNHKEKFQNTTDLKHNPFYALMFAASGFTPDSLATSSVIYNDRPYASIILLQTSISNPLKDRYKNYQSTFTYGWLGSSLPGRVQTTIHIAMNDNDTKAPRTPRGWHNQVSDGGEPTFAYSYVKEILLTKQHLNNLAMATKSKGLEIKHGYTYSLGYYTYAGYEIAARLGCFNAHNWTYTSSRLASLNKNINTFDENKQTNELYLLASVRPVFMLYNALLNGAFKKSVYTVNFNDTRHLIVEMDIGAGGSLALGRSMLNLRIKGSARSPEFKLPGRPARFHYWAGLEIIYGHL